MLKNLIIIILFSLVAYFISRYEADQAFDESMNQTKTTIENIYHAESTEESQKYVEEHNTRAKEEMVILKQRAKSPESIKFTELTEEQNSHADDATHYTSQFLPLTHRIENMGLDGSDPVLLKETFTELCTLHKKYLSSLDSIQKILTEKVDMVNQHPVILEEIVEGTPKQQEEVKSVMQLMLDNQSKILFEEQQSHLELRCPQFLANTTDL